MGWHHTRWVRRDVRGVRAADKAILFVIADATPNDKASVTLCQAELAAEAGMSERSLRDVLNRLRAAGLLATSGKGGRHGDRGIYSTYRLNVPAEIADENPAEFADLEFRTRRDLPGEDLTRQNLPPLPGEICRQKGGEICRQRRNTESPLKEEGGTAREIEEAVEAWNALAERAGLSSVQRITDPRKRAIRARLKELGGLEGWAMLLEKIEAAPFLTGQKKGRDGRDPFRANLDWIIKPQNTLKIMEGQYDGQARHEDRRGENGPGTAGPYGPTNGADPALEQISGLAGLGQAQGNGRF